MNGRWELPSTVARERMLHAHERALPSREHAAALVATHNAIDGLKGDVSVHSLGCLVGAMAAVAMRQVERPNGLGLQRVDGRPRCSLMGDFGLIRVVVFLQLRRPVFASLVCWTCRDSAAWWSEVD